MRFEINEADQAALCRQAPEFIPAVRDIRLAPFECCGDLFYALIRSIVSQQLAVRAAEAIFDRVEKVLGTVSPERVLAASPETLRECGLSLRKIEYLRGAALAAEEGRIDFPELAKRSDAEVVETLVKLRGVGVWTAEMLLIFALGRPDVLSFRDLGIRTGLAMLYGVEELSPERFEDIRRRVSPCGTLASLYLWRIKDGGLPLRGGA